jgi:hypothetical protein
MLPVKGGWMLYNLLGALTGLTLLTLGVAPTHVDSQQSQYSQHSQLAGEPQAIEAKAKSKHKHKHKQFEVAGSFSVVHNGPPSINQVAGDLCAIELSPSFVFIDDLDGSFSSSFVIEHAGACDQPAPEYFSTDGVWTGSILGAEGSFEYTFEGTIDAEGIATGELVVVDDSGTDGLEGLEGSLTLTGLAGVKGSYSGTLAFHH